MCYQDHVWKMNFWCAKYFVFPQYFVLYGRAYSLFQNTFHKTVMDFMFNQSDDDRMARCMPSTAMQYAKISIWQLDCVSLPSNELFQPSKPIQKRKRDWKFWQLDHRMLRFSKERQGTERGLLCITHIYHNTCIVIIRLGWCEGVGWAGKTNWTELIQIDKLKTFSVTNSWHRPIVPEAEPSTSWFSTMASYVGFWG